MCRGSRGGSNLPDPPAGSGGDQRPGTAKPARESSQQQLEGVVGELTAHPAAANLLLHPLQAVEHDQVAAAVTQAPLQPLQPTARRAFLLAVN